MIIDDLEFINFCDRPDSSSFSVIHGGASASVSTSTSITDGNASASSSAYASGDMSAAYTASNSALVNGSIPHLGINYVVGYASSYGTAYAIDGNRSFAYDTSTSTSVV